MCRKLNIINTRDEFHGALLDADLLCKVFLRLTAGKQENLNLNNFKTNEKKDIRVKEKLDLNNRKESIDLTEIEFENHVKMIKKMKDPIWDKI